MEKEKKNPAKRHNSHFSGSYFSPERARKPAHQFLKCFQKQLCPGLPTNLQARPRSRSGVFVKTSQTNSFVLQAVLLRPGKGQ